VGYAAVMSQTFVQSPHDVVEFLKNQHTLIKDLFDISSAIK
jgi:hypothetical protein